MSKRKPSGGRPRGSGSDRRRLKDRKPDAAEEKTSQSLLSGPAIREIVESIVIAFVLAFLFRTFEAEAFVIPTGSMAPTLMGRHKDVTCPKCGYSYRASASDEVFPNSGSLRSPEFLVEGCTCPMCRYTMDLGPGNPQDKTYWSFKGDRILVNKFAYQLGDPRRWDVAVFKYPGESKTNFIKRIVGLPNETIRISHGDVSVKRDGEQDFTIARKHPNKLRAMLQTVFDNDFAAEIIEEGWPARWLPPEAVDDRTEGAWQPSKDSRRFSTDGTAAAEVWLRYHHLVPSFGDWLQMSRGGTPQLKEQLIADFCAYNTNRSRQEMQINPAPAPDSLGLHWVGDLAVACTMTVPEVQSGSGEVVLELIEGGRRFQCRFDVATGEAALSIVGLDSFHPAALTEVCGPGTYRVMFSNVDDQLRLWVNGKVVDFGQPTEYEPLENFRPREADLTPVGIASRGTALEISELKVLRDIYYIAERSGSHAVRNVITDFDSIDPFRHAGSVAGFLADETLWDAFDFMHSVEFPLAEGQFLVLGDNSAKSKDSRLWETPTFEEYYVSRELLIGKALFIYWPDTHFKVRLLGFSLPVFPNFQGMGFVR